MIVRLWTYLYPDSLLPPGEYQLLLPEVRGLGRDIEAEFPPNLLKPGKAVAGMPADSQDGEGEKDMVLLLRDGTEIGRLQRAAWERAARLTLQEKVVWWKRNWVEEESRDLPTLWTTLWMDRERLLRWTDWPSGIRFEAGTSVSNVPSSKPQFQRQLDFEWSQKPFPYFLVGAALHRTVFGGGLLQSALLERAAGEGGDTVHPDFWNGPHWWWSLSAGIPGARYTFYLADRPLPSHFWLETRAATLIRSGRAGDVVRQWAGDDLGRDGNVGHRLDLRLAYLRYQVNWDGDAYASAVQSLELDDLPAFFGRWGAGLVFAGKVAATRAWLDIPDFAFSLARPTAYPSRFRFALLHLDLAYRSLKSFQLGASISMRLENPLLNLPGASR